MALAVSLVFFNKQALSGFNFPCANIITLSQLACSLLLLTVLRRLKLVQFTAESESTRGPDRGDMVPWATVMHTLPLSGAYLLYMVLGMSSLRGVNLAMYTTLRRTTAAFTMAAEYVIARKTQPGSVVLSVATMVGGAMLAGAGDLAFDLYAYALVLACNAATALYLATISRLGKSSGLNSFGLMWSNALVCAPALTVICWVTGELEMARSFPLLHDPGFQTVIALSCILAFMLNYTVFLNTVVNSALTQTVCGNLKDVAIIFIGFFTFGGMAVDPLSVAGVSLGLLGSVLYAYIKLRSGTG